MSYQHQALAAGRWKALTFTEQMANVGSEVERALGWRAKRHDDYAQQAFGRALELLDLTLAEADSAARRREVARVREALADFFAGGNVHTSTEASWRAYFGPFMYAARRNH